MGNWKIGTKLLTIILSVSLVLISILIAVNIKNYTTVSLGLIESQSKQLAYRHANRVRGDFDKLSMIAKNIADVISGLKEEQHVDREGLLAILKAIISQNNNIVGIFTVFEPNAFGGTDEDYIGSKGADETGRFVPFYYRDNGIKLKLTSDYHENDAKNNFYMIPKNTGKDFIDDPVLYDLGDQKKLLTAYVVPIKHQGKFIGVVATILDLGDFQDLILKIHPGGNGFGVLVSNNGVFVAHPPKNGKSIVGLKYLDVLGHSEITQKRLVAIQKGELIAADGVMPKTQEPIKVVYAPIQIGTTTTPWSIGIIMPLSILDKINNVKWFSVIFGIVTLLILAGIIIYTVFRVVTKPLVEISNYATKISEGELDFPIEIERKDEIGVLANSFREVQKTSSNLSSLISNIHDNYVEGNLEAKVETKGFKGEWQGLIGNILDSFELVIAPVREGIRILTKIQRGDLREKMNIDLKGDFNLLKDAVNGVHMGLLFIIDFSKKIAKGEVDVEVLKASDEDQIHEWLVLMRDNIKHIVSEVNKFASFSMKGDFDNIRFDSSETKGAYADILSNLTKTVEAIKKPLTEVEQVMLKMASKDLSAKVEGDYQGVYKNLKESINGFADSINQALSQVASSTEEINTGSSQISDASQNLSSVATEQAGSVEEITSTITELATKTKQNSDNAEFASKLARTAKETAEKGTEQAEQTTRAMELINNSSEEIKKIIKVIDDIAFQTNLLALNAAVEAARAGVHGKGFGVVADEVRNLAQRSAEAAKETTQLIEESTKNVEVGNKAVKQTVASLNEILEGSIKTADIVEEITASNEEQKRDIEQSNQGLKQISESTQQNAAVAEETASVSVELSSQAENLREMVGSFKLANNSAIFVKNENKKNIPNRRNQPRMITANQEYKIEDSSSDDFGEF